jgi:hypothetical protein
VVQGPVSSLPRPKDSDELLAKGYMLAWADNEQLKVQRSRLAWYLWNVLRPQVRCMREYLSDGWPDSGDASGVSPGTDSAALPASRTSVESSADSDVQGT